MQSVTIATRESPLALWQAEFVADLLRQAHPDLTVKLMPMTSQGDKVLDRPLMKVGGKGLFVKELETALLSGSADLAVHSLKDMPSELPDGLCLTGVLKRHSPYDAWVSNDFADPSLLPEGARVGTSSLRRASQLKAWRPDLEISWLRGNVNTRLSKLDDGLYQGIILAESGLKRLGFDQRIAHTFPHSILMPAAGQGVLAIESRSEDDRIKQLIAPLLCSETAILVAAERQVNKALGGGCHVPIAAWARIEGNQVVLTGRVGAPSGQRLIESEKSSVLTTPAEAVQLGQSVADDLLSQGAQAILNEAGSHDTNFTDPSQA